jgi:hypothetical protein
MDFGQLISATPLWAVFAVTFAAFMIAVEAGVRLARVLRREGEADADAPLGTIVGSILGLVAFILAFTFGMTASRFDARKQLVLEEANACGACYLRAGLLPGTESAEIRRLLREYVGLRLEGVREPTRIGAAIARSEEIHGELWRRAQSLVGEEMDSEVRSLFLESLNNVIDLHESRKTVGLIYRIPSAIWMALYLLSLLAMLAIGYQAGMTGQTGARGARRRCGMAVLAAAFALVTAMIADLDRPAGSRFRVSEQPLADVDGMMRGDANPE